MGEETKRHQGATHARADARRHLAAQVENHLILREDTLDVRARVCVCVKGLVWRGRLGVVCVESANNILVHTGRGAGTEGGRDERGRGIDVEMEN